MRGRGRAAIALEDAEGSPCGNCGRTTKTVQGVCAECWASKGGPPMGWKKRPPRDGGGSFLLDVILSLFPWWP